MIIQRKQQSFPEQREFARWTRPFKRTIGRVRTGLAEKLSKSGQESLERGQVISRTKGSVARKIDNPELAERILKNEVPEGVAISRESSMARNGGGGVFVRPQNVSKDALNNPSIPSHEKEFIRDIIKGGKGGVAVEKDLGVEVLGHEVGHSKNATGKGLKRKISNSDPRNSELGMWGDNVHMYPGAKNQYRYGSPDKVSFKEALKDLKRDTVNSGIILSEEKNANKEALRMMKKQGASKKEIKEAKDILNSNTEVYKGMAKGSLKSGLGRLINIPSRRGTGTSLI